MIKKGLAVAVILLFIGMCVVPSTAVTELKDVSTVSFDGNILYVGGSGAGNYTKIQDAIDNATDGDTVFVYNESSPYNESIVIDKSISLVGEDKETTIINANDNINVIKINEDYVNIKNFYIYGNKGIYLTSDNSVISNNIFDIEDKSIECESGKSNNNIISSNEFYGSGIRQICAIHLLESNYNYINKNYVHTYLENGFYIVGDNNIISENLFLYDNEENPYELEFGDIVITGNFNEIFNNNLTLMITYSSITAITLKGVSSNNIIKGNTINDGSNEHYSDGIEISNGCTNNVISNNKISTCLNGIIINEYSCDNEILYNLIIDCYVGVYINEHSTKNVISNNNLWNNERNAMFSDASLDNTWDGNYWDKPRAFLYPIFGYISIRFFWFIIWGLLIDTFPPSPLIKIDWHPASEPYDIGV